MPNTKRTQRLRGVCERAPKYPFSGWGRRLSFLLPNATWAVPLCEALFYPAGGSKYTSRAKGSRRNLGDPTSGRRLRVRSRVRRSASGRRRAVADECNGGGKSDEAIVAVKPANKAERSAAELVERGAEAKGNACYQKHAPDPAPGSACHRRSLHAYHRVFDDAFGTRGRSRKRESLMTAPVRGASASPPRPYRDRDLHMLWRFPKLARRAHAGAPGAIRVGKIALAPSKPSTA